MISIFDALHNPEQAIEVMTEAAKGFKHPKKELALSVIGDPKSEEYDSLVAAAEEAKKRGEIGKVNREPQLHDHTIIIKPDSGVFYQRQIKPRDMDMLINFVNKR